MNVSVSRLSHSVNIVHLLMAGSDRIGLLCSINV